MLRVFKSSVLLTTMGLMAFGSSPAPGQCGTRSYPPSGSSGRAVAPTNSARQSAQQLPLALEGYCPVSLLKMRKWVKGDAAYQSTYDGRIYRFAGEQGKQMFDADPAAYVPDQPTRTMIASQDFSVSFLKYDWGLNKQ